jgi:hypothetical protein
VLSSRPGVNDTGDGKFVLNPVFPAAYPVCQYLPSDGVNS